MATEAYNGGGWIATKLEWLINWGRKRSPWPLPYGTACCGIEMMCALAAGYDMARFGAERPSFSPRQADVLIQGGTITLKMAPAFKRIYDQMAEPRCVISMGACACSGGVFRTYPTLQGIDKLVPVDIYIPGCPPRPEALLQALLMFIEKTEKSQPITHKKHSDLLVGT